MTKSHAPDASDCSNAQSAPLRSAVGNPDNENPLQGDTMSRQSGREGFERWSDPDGRAGHGSAGERSQQGQEQCQLTNTQTGRENFNQAATRPTSAGQTFVERIEARRQDFRSRDARPAPDGRMLEQSSNF